MSLMFWKCDLNVNSRTFVDEFCTSPTKDCHAYNEGAQVKYLTPVCSVGEYQWYMYHDTKKYKYHDNFW